MINHYVSQAFLCVISTSFFYLSMIGWGWWLLKLLKISRPIDISVLAAWGVALSVFLGGIFNIFDIISLFFARSYLFFGALSCVYLTFSFRYSILLSIRTRIHLIAKDPLTISLFIVLIILLGLRIADAGFKSFNTHDDFYSYLVMPLKMIQSGSIEATAFNERRMSVLGGQSFLHALVISLLDIRYLNVLDLGVGWILLIGLIAGHGLQKNLHVRTILSLLLVCQFVDIPSLNLSSVVTGSALFYALIRTTLLIKNETKIARILIVSLMVAGLCSLKNSYLITSTLFLFFVSLTSRDNPFFENCKTLIITGILTCILFLPWMLNLYQNNGTLLFPIFGLGFQGEAYGNYPSVAVGDLTFRTIFYSMRYPLSKGIFYFGLLLVSMIFLQRKNCPIFIFALIVFISTWSSGLILLISSGGITRYLYPTVCTATIFLLTDYISYLKPSEKMTGYTKSLILTFLFITLLFGFHRFNGIYNPALALRRIPKTKLQWSDADRSKIENAQAAVPTDGIILARVSKPFLMDFNRNTIYAIDSPGGASPPPGLPCFGTLDDIVRYLNLLEIKFLIYSYKDEAGFARENFMRWTHLKGGGYISRVRIATLHAFAFQQRLNKLGKLYPKVYDDGEIFVLQVDSKSP